VNHRWTAPAGPHQPEQHRLPLRLRARQYLHPNPQRDAAVDRGGDGRVRLRLALARLRSRERLVEREAHGAVLHDGVGADDVACAHRDAHHLIDTGERGQGHRGLGTRRGG